MSVTERWLPLPGYPGYEVSDEGRVRGLLNCFRNPRAVPLTLKPTITSQGYERYVLRRDRRKCNLFAQRMVLEAFVGPCPSGMQCRHLDGNPRNNRLENLAWGTSQENMADQRAHGTLASGEKHYAKTQPERLPRGSAHGCAKLTEEQVIAIRQSPESFGQLAKRFGVARSTVARAATGKRWKHVG